MKLRRALKWTSLAVLSYLAVAYLILPLLWSHHEHQPGLALHPATTETSQGIPGDPLNVGLVGDMSEVIKAMHAAGWYPADPVTLKSSLEIAGSVVFDRPYHEAPVSPLLYEGRKQDLAFEKPIGKSADRRNHVRYWKVLENGSEGRQVWLGSATLDRGVGVSHYTGQITHHIAPDIDDERNRLMDELSAARMLAQVYEVSGIGPTMAGRNGGGDWYYTDGEVKIGVVSPGAVAMANPPQIVANAPFIELKNGIWSSVSGLVSQDGPDQ